MRDILGMQWVLLDGGAGEVAEPPADPGTPPAVSKHPSNPTNPTLGQVYVQYWRAHS